MSMRTLWKQVTIVDTKTQKDKLVGMMKIEVKASFLPLSELSVKKIIASSENSFKNS